jgi:Caspase domain
MPRQAPTRFPFTPRRRALLGAPLAATLGLGGWTQRVSAWGDDGPVRLALLVGNRAYPSPFDLPPTHKNVRDLKAVLEQRGFKVTTALDLDPDGLKRAVARFAESAKGAPADASVLFYFTGHGLQVDAENLLVGASVNPSSGEPVLLNGSLHFKRDLVDSLPHRPSGMTMMVIDACRTNLRAAIKAGDGFNQVEAPLGCLIAFSTGAGKPAISPSVETQNTFYTASLIKVLASASDDITFSDLFRLVKSDVQQTMLNHPVSAIRNMAQFPFIAENLRMSMRLSLKPGDQTEAPVKFSNDDEAASWRELQASTWPVDIIKQANDYLKRFPKSTLAASAEVAREGADEAAQVMKRNDVRLFKSAFFPKGDSTALVPDIRKAARGDKDAAARIARIYKVGDEASKDINRYEGWMQYASALGNGIAAYELALYYRTQDQPLMASQFETRAKELGYTPPLTLDNSRK